MKLNALMDNYGARQNATRVGRGMGSGSGKTAVLVERIIKIITGDTAKDAIAGSTLNVLYIQLLCHLNNGIFGRLQSIVKTLQHGHRKNNLTVLVRLEKAYQVGRNFPDKIRFCLYICISLLLQFIH